MGEPSKSHGRPAEAGPISVRLDAASAFVRARVKTEVRIGMVLGSGLGGFVDRLEDAVRVPYAEIPHMPTPSVSGHHGALVVGRVAGVSVACLQGRVHLYEGHDLERVVFGVRMLARLGVGAVLLTNAAGGLRPTFAPGRLMLITDHLNLTGKSPLVGPNDSALGVRFPDMTRAYDQRLTALARDAAAATAVRLDEGVYAGLLGPQYETPAEIAMLRTLGADAVGMSTVHEVIALRHMKMRTAAISCITNLAAGMTAADLHHAEVEQAAAQAQDSMGRLFEAWIRLIGAADAPGG